MGFLTRSKFDRRSYQNRRSRSSDERLSKARQTAATWRQAEGPQQRESEGAEAVATGRSESDALGRHTVRCGQAKLQMIADSARRRPSNSWAACTGGAPRISITVAAPLVGAVRFVARRSRTRTILRPRNESLDHRKTNRQHPQPPPKLCRHIEHGNRHSPHLILFPRRERRTCSTGLHGRSCCAPNAGAGARSPDEAAHSSPSPSAWRTGSS